MILPDQTPKLPKWPFLVGDAALLGAAWFIASSAAQPLSAEPAIAIAACIIFAAIVGAIPFLADYARRQDEALDNRQRALEALARTSSAAAEQISIAAAGLGETTESAERSLGQARALPEALSKEIAELGAQLARSRAEERKALDKELGALRASLSGQLEAAAEKFARTAVELEKAVAALRERADAPTQVVIREVAPEARPLEPVVAAAPEPDPIPQPTEPAPTPASFATDVASEAKTPDSPALEATVAATEPAPEAVPAPPAPKPPRKRAPRKAPVAPPLAQESTPADSTTPTKAPETVEPPVLELESPPAASSEFSQASPDEDAPTSSISADGATRLLVTAYIGIGNRLFVRGEGPGLSWERGVPLQFVSIGKWRWDTMDATAPISYKLYKNDEVECPSLGVGTLQAGQQQEVTAVF